LKEDSEFYSRFFTRGGQSVCAFCRDVNGLFDKYVQPVTGRSYALLGVQSRWAAYENNLHRPVFEKGFKVLIRDAAVSFGQALHLFNIPPADGYDFYAVNRSRRARMRPADIAAP
jgi:hypothetical protein